MDVQCYTLINKNSDKCVMSFEFIQVFLSYLMRRLIELTSNIRETSFNHIIFDHTPNALDVIHLFLPQRQSPIHGTYCIFDFSTKFLASANLDLWI